MLICYNYYINTLKLNQLLCISWCQHSNHTSRQTSTVLRATARLSPRPMTTTCRSFKSSSRLASVASLCSRLQRIFLTRNLSMTTCRSSTSQDTPISQSYPRLNNLSAWKPRKTSRLRKFLVSKIQALRKQVSSSLLRNQSALMTLSLTRQKKGKRNASSQTASTSIENFTPEECARRATTTTDGRKRQPNAPTKTSWCTRVGSAAVAITTSDTSNQPRKENRPWLKPYRSDESDS